MSASSRKDRVAGIGIYKAPPNLSKEALETKITSLVDALLAVPIAQKNFLKFEIIYQNEFLNPHLKALGFPEAPASVWLRLECETDAHGAEILTDPALVKVYAEAEEFLPYVMAFMADVVTKIDLPTPRNPMHIMCTFQCPAHLSSNEYRTKFEGFVDRLLALPITQKSILKYSVVNQSQWMPNNTLDAPLRDLGFPQLEPVFVVMAETEAECVQLE
ncbi:hypothetical protein C8F04DRAFT_1245392 [Mycena alexandri]|uniref:Uncharacterized protein n=1 Tax=Mycena alexandri TaxID=1745969 RepID=A0AAD6RVY9_9AGAR|nr:hypothetical protein C8F04DRAFT_1245392 [Mycena alexandri]